MTDTKLNTNHTSHPYTLHRLLGLVGIIAVFLLFSVSGRAENSPFQQKFSLVNRFLDHSKTAKRVAGSGHHEGNTLLKQARAKRDSAQVAHASGDEKRAMDLLNQSLRLASEASRKSADPASQLWIHKARYDDLSESIRYFQDTYQKYQKHAPSQKRHDADKLLKEAANLTASATHMAHKNELKKANQKLSQAQELLVSGLKPLLGSRSLVYEVKFETPQDEYEYELRRGESLEALIRMKLLEEQKEGVTKQILAFSTQSRENQQQAQKIARAGNFEAAINVQEDANQFLVRALRVLGVMIPL